MRTRLLVVVSALLLVVPACGGGTTDDTTADTQPPQTSPPATEPPADDHDDGDDHADEDMRAISAPVADIIVDGDSSDWAGVPGMDLTLEAIEGEDVPSLEASVKVAHDGAYVYMLFEVDDDYDFNPDDPHLSASPSVMWAIDPGAGEHMGAEEPDRETSLGMVDIWHWELECGIGESSGGAVSGPGEGKDPGNDAACNFDDEWSTIPEEREDDNGSGAENSLLGVWTHTSPTNGSDGTYTFEMRRPLVTGDAQDAEFSAGQIALMALAYWDADYGPDGWDDDTHVQSSNQGWIEVALLGG